jgi:macrolide transport system ATP-binding/permease protein
MWNGRRIWRRIAFLTKRRQFESELEEEMRFHREMLQSHHPAPQARFGNTTLMKEASRETWSFAAIETFFKDLRYAMRMLRRSPAFTVVAVLSLALGIGANTAIFSLIDTLMLKSLPVPQPEQLVELLTVRGTSRFNAFSYQAYLAIRDRNHAFSRVFASRTDRFYVVAQGAEPERADTSLVTGTFFAGLGVKPFIGQLIATEDDRAGAPAVAAISYAYWKRRFGLDHSVLGKKIAIEDIPHTIIGVTPPEFFGAQVGHSDDIFIPLSTEALIHHPSWMSSSGYKWLGLIARLKPGASILEARAEVATIFKGTLEDDLKITKDAGDAAFIRTFTAEVLPAGAGFSQLRRRFSRPLLILMVIVGLVLLIACANVANLLLARATARQKEISVRVAIGAGRLRLIRQMLTESFLLAFLGGALGLALAWWGSNYLIAFMGTGRLNIKLEVHPDARMLLFTLAVSLLTAILFGIAPAIRGANADIFPALKDAARAATGFRHRFGKALVVSQVVVSVLLLVGAGLFSRTLINLENIDVGFDRGGVLLVSLDPSHSGYQGTQLAVLYKELLERFNGLPGVRSASLSRFSPITGGGVNFTLSIAGQVPRPDQKRSIYINWVSPRYFETLGTPLLLGRDFNSRDDPNSNKVAIVNESMARLFFDNGNPLGKRVVMGPGDAEIVGVVKDAKYLEIREDPTPTVYLAVFQEKKPYSEFELRTAVAQGGIVSAVRRQVRDATNGHVAISKTQTLAEQVDASIVQERLVATLSAFFGALGLLLASIGLYGLLAYAVTRRTNEIGIRVALGAGRRDVVRMVLGEAMLLVGIGLVIGIPAALGGARLVSSQLYGVSAHDPLTVAGSALVLIGVAFLAAWLPARRAARVDPMVALRYE